MPDQPFNPKHWVIIPAAGVGARMAADRPKQYLSLSGRTIIEHTIAIFEKLDWVSGIAVGLSEEDSYWAEIAPGLSSKVHTYTGGAERADTVSKGLAFIEELVSADDWVWIHDAARPCLAPGDILKLKNALTDSLPAGAILAAPVHDTVKLAGLSGTIEKTLDRSKMWRALTPQAFRFEALRAALAHCETKGVVVTDEASALEAKGAQPLLVEGRASNIKVTRPQDMEQARLMIKASTELRPRLGNGYDVHAFEPGNYVTLGGVKIPHSMGLKAHSDGDVALHALMDAMLGALALGDIGKHFPDTDERWKGADSRLLLRAVNELVREKGYQVGNADLTIIAQRPKMAPHIELMARHIAEDLGLAPHDVGVKATTTEKLGFCGREEGIATQASVLLFPL